MIKLVSMTKFLIQFILIIVIFLSTSIEVSAQENYEVRGIELRGVQTLSTGQLKTIMSTYATGGFQSTFLGKESALFSEDILKSDLKRLVRFYQREGFLYAKADIAFLELNRKNRTLRIKIDIDEGDSITVRNIRYQSFDSLNPINPSVNSAIHNVNKTMRLRTGHRFRDDDLKKDRTVLARALENTGYPYAEFIPVLAIDENEKVVDVTWSVKPGPLSVFGQIDIIGNRYVNSELIRKSLTTETGGRYNRNALEESQRQVFGLGLFYVVTVTAQLTETQDTLIPIEVYIKESPRLTTKIGVGYGREEKFRVFSDSYYLGFLGDARRLNLFAKHSDIEPYHLSLKLIQPAFLSNHTTLEINPFILKQKEPAFTENRYGGQVSLLHQFTVGLHGSITYSLERVNLDTNSLAVEEIANTQTDFYNKSSIQTGLTFDNSVPVFSPTRGFYAGAVFKISGLGLGSDYHYTRLIFDIRRYQPLLGMVLAGRFKLGGIKSTDDHQFVPLEDRFYSGGSASVRGWARSELGPVTDGIPIGGKSLIETSAELRFPIIGILSGAVFYDFGNVWLSSYSFHLNDLRYSAVWEFESVLLSARCALTWLVP